MLSKQLERSDMTTRHLNQRELAERLNISPRTLERWRWIGTGPTFLKVEGRVIYRLADVEAYERAQLRKGTAKPGARP